MLHDALRARLPDLDDAIFDQRWHFFITEAFAGQWVRAYVFKVTEHDAGQSAQEIERDYLMRYLDYVEGGLTAPTKEQQNPALSKVNSVLYP